MSARKYLFGLSLMSILASPLAALADPIYSMTFLPESVIGAAAIDNNGLIALTFQGPAIAEAGLWSGGSITPLGFLGTGRLSGASGISNSGGQVSGSSEISSGPDFGQQVTQLGFTAGFGTTHYFATLPDPRVFGIRASYRFGAGL